MACVVLDIRITSSVDEEPGYWEEDLRNACMSPSRYYSKADGDLMLILARSRDGQHLVVRDEQCNAYLVGIRQGTPEPLPIAADHAKPIIITDALPVEVEALTISTPGVDELLFEEPAQQRVTFWLPAHCVMYENGEGAVVLYRMEQGTTEVLAPRTVKAQAASSYIQRHSLGRSAELTAAFALCPHPISTQPADFVPIFRSDPLLFPSIFSAVNKKVGRPAYSTDKNPRSQRSPPLLPDEEIEVYAQ
jgi:hypothetical protein